MHELIGKTAYDRFRYALFPNAIESRSVNGILKKVDRQPSISGSRSLNTAEHC